MTQSGNTRSTVLLGIAALVVGIALSCGRSCRRPLEGHLATEVRRQVPPARTQGLTGRHLQPAAARHELLTVAAAPRKVLGSEPGNGRIRGRVIDALGVPVQDAYVEAWVRLAARPEVTATTNQLGLFELSWSGSKVVRVCAGDPAHRLLSEQVVDVSPGSDLVDLELVLSEPSPARFVVRRHRLLGDAPVALWVQDEDGRERGRVAAMPWREVTLELPRGLDIAVHVESPDGRYRGVGHATVRPHMGLLYLSLDGPWVVHRVVLAGVEGDAEGATACVVRGDVGRWRSEVGRGGMTELAIAPACFGQQCHVVVERTGRILGHARLVVPPEGDWGAETVSVLPVQRLHEQRVRLRGPRDQPAAYLAWEVQTGSSGRADAQGEFQFIGVHGDVVHVSSGGLNLGRIVVGEQGCPVLDVAEYAVLAGELQRHGETGLRAWTLAASTPGGEVLVPIGEASTWTVGLPYAPGTPVTAWGICEGAVMTDKQRSMLSGAPVHLVAQGAEFVVQPIRGALARPEGAIQITRVPAESDSDRSIWRVTHSRPAVRIFPCAPGVYDIAFRPDGGAWLNTIRRVTMGPERTVVLLDFE